MYSFEIDRDCRDNCKICPHNRKIMVNGHADGELEDIKLMVVGEAPEDLALSEGLPFQGDQMQDIKDYVEKNLPIKPSQVYYTYAWKCGGRGDYLPDDPKYKENLINLCRGNIHSEIAEIKPDVILLLGAPPLASVLKKRGVESQRGNIYEIVDIKREVDAKVIPTFHPYYVMLEPSYAPLLRADIELVQTLLETGGVDPRLNKPTDVQIVRELSDIRDLLKEYEGKEVFSFDTETTGEFYWSADQDILCFTLSHTPGEAHLIPLVGHKMAKLQSDLDRAEIYKLLLECLNTRDGVDKHVVMQNGDYDWKQLEGLGYRVAHIPWYDTYHMQHVYDSGLKKKGLEVLTELYTTLPNHKQILAGFKRKRKGAAHDYSRFTNEELWPYAGQDADATLRVFIELKRLLEREGLWDFYLSIEKPYASAMLNVSLSGIPVTAGGLKTLQTKLEKTAKEYKDVLIRATGNPDFNPNSPPQVAELLFDQLQLPEVTKRSTDANTLDTLLSQAPDIIQPLMDYRKDSKLVTTYVKGYTKCINPDTGRMHAGFDVAGTSSGRCVSRKPNVCNVARDRDEVDKVTGEKSVLSIKEVFEAPVDWKFLCADYSQIELKIIALLSQDKAMLAAFEDRSGPDIHETTARAIFPDFDTFTPVGKKDARVVAKAFNFGIAYGATYKGIAFTTGISEELAKVRYNLFFNTYKQLKTWMNNVNKEVDMFGEVRTPFGRRRMFPRMITRDYRTQGAQERQAVNFVPQSAAGEVGGQALVRIVNECHDKGLRAYPVNLIYDMIVMVSPDNELAQARDILARHMLMPIPELNNFIFSVEMGVGQDWHAAEKKGTEYLTYQHFIELTSAP